MRFEERQRLVGMIRVLYPNAYLPKAINRMQKDLARLTCELKREERELKREVNFERTTS